MHLTVQILHLTVQMSHGLWINTFLNLIVLVLIILGTTLFDCQRSGELPIFKTPDAVVCPLTIPNFVDIVYHNKQTSLKVHFRDNYTSSSTEKVQPVS